jgi:choline-sulfatase
MGLPFLFMRPTLRTSLFLIALLVSAGVTQAAEKPNIVLVTLDTVRADRMGFLGSTRGLTPQMDALARQSIVFERAYSQAPLTPVAHASILTGTYPQFHELEDFGQRLGTSLPYLPDLLHASGYRTGAFVSSIILDPRNGFAPGFERGFDTYDAGFHRRRRGEPRYSSVQRRARDTVSQALEWLDHNSNAPFFLWVHLWDAHEPYDPPAPYAKRFAAAPYDGAIAYVDAEVGRLLGALRTKQLFANALIVLLSDHGEGLGGHGEKTHGVLLYDETIHVPLIVKLPGNRSAGQRVAARVGQIDVAPTILEVAHLAVPKEMQGQSAVRLIGSKSAADRPSYAETQYSRRAFGWSPLSAVRIEKYLYVKAPQEELYNLAADPAAANNLATKEAATTARIREQLAAFLARFAKSTKEGSQEGLDPETAQKLASLGYVASGGRGAGASAIDPKTRIQVANAVHDANLAIEDNKPEVAIPLLERVVRSDPQIQSAQYFLGMAYARQKKYAQAIPPLRKAIELQPDAVMAHYEMGMALFETGDWKTAATHFEIVVGRNPTWADARFSLAAVQARIDRVPDAMANLVLVLEQVPGHYRANLLLGRLLTLKGQADAALPYLEKAAEVQADSAEAHAFLADAYERLGRSEEAQRERDKAAELRRTRQSRSSTQN